MSDSEPDDEFDNNIDNYLAELFDTATKAWQKSQQQGVFYHFTQCHASQPLLGQAEPGILMKLHANFDNEKPTIKRAKMQAE